MPQPSNLIFRQVNRRDRHHIGVMIDWTACPDVERTPGKVSGAWCVKGTRIPLQAILDNAEDCTPEEIAGPDIFPSLTVDGVRRILAYARS
jgi:uncharacterized protein (DUF433 family)